MFLDEADQGGFAIIKNEEREKAVRDVMIAIIDKLESEFTGTPRQVFGALGKRRARDGAALKHSDPQVTELKHTNAPWNWFRSRSG